MVALKSIHRLLLVALTLELVIIPLAYSWSNGIVDPYVHKSVASDIRSLIKHRVDLTRIQFKDSPFVNFLAVTIVQATGISPTSAEYIPIGGFFFVLAIFAISRTLGYSLSIAGFLAGILIFRWLPITLFTFWPHTFGFAFYLLFIMVYFKSEKRRATLFLFTLWLLFMAVHFYSYTVELWVIAFIGFVCVVSIVKRESNKFRNVSMLLSFVVTFATFTEIIYRAYLPKLEGGGGNVLIGFEYLFSSQLRRGAPVPYAWIPPPVSPILLVLDATYYILLPLPVAALAITKIAQRLAPKSGVRASLPRPFTASIILALFLVWLPDFASYASVGAVSVGALRYITLAVSLVAVWCLETNVRLRTYGQHPRSKRVLTFSYATILFICTFAIFGLTLGQGYVVESSSRYTEAQPGAAWFFSHVGPGRDMISDHNTQGQYSIAAAGLGLYFKGETFYNSTSYGQLINPTNTPSHGAYYHNRFVVINVALSKQKTVVGGTWIDYEPIISILPSISENAGLEKVYDDGYSWILTGR